MTRLALTACLILALAGLLWGNTDNPGMGAHGVGSYWTYTFADGDTLTHEIIDRIERRGRQMLLVAVGDTAPPQGNSCFGSDAELWDAETGSWAACLKDGTVLVESVPHDGRYSFPMAVGNTWRNTASWMDNVIDWSGTYTQNWQVVAHESITVPAGTFMAFRIDSVNEGSGGPWPSLWYSATEKFLVKFLWSGNVYELSDYEVVEHVIDDNAAVLREMVFENPDPGKPSYIIAGQNASLQYWTTPDGAVSQALYRSADESVSVRTYYDEATGLPRRISDEISRNWLLIQENGDDSVDFWSYDHDGAYQNGFAVIEDSGQYYVGEIAGLPTHAGKEITGELLPTTASWSGSFTLEIDTGDLRTRKPLAAEVAELMDDLATDDTLHSGLSVGGMILLGLVDDSTGEAVAPADRAAFDALAGGKIVAFTYTDSGRTDSVEFMPAGRFVLTDQNDSKPGNFRYVNTGQDTGTITLTFDPNNDPAEYERVFEVTFTSGTMGTCESTYTEGSQEPVVTSGHFKIVDWVAPAGIATAGAAAFVTSLFVPDVAAGNPYKCTRLANATSRDLCRLAADFLAHEVERGPTGLVRDGIDWVRDNPVSLGDLIDKGEEALENIAARMLPDDAIHVRNDTESFALEIPPPIGSRARGEAIGPDGKTVQMQGSITPYGDFAVTGDDDDGLSVAINGRIGDSGTTDSEADAPTLKITQTSASRAAMGNVIAAGDATPDAGGFEWGPDNGRVRSVLSTTVLAGNAPVVVRKIRFLMGPKDGPPATLDLSAYFSDPNGDALSFTAVAPYAQDLDLRVSGSMLTIRLIASGRSLASIITWIRVTATDPGGLTAEMSFPVRAYPAPVTVWSWITERSLSHRFNAYPGWEIRGNSNLNTIFDCHELVILHGETYQNLWRNKSEVGFVLPMMEEFQRQWHRGRTATSDRSIPDSDFLLFRYDTLPSLGQRLVGQPRTFEGLRCSDVFVTYGGCRRTTDWGALTSFFGCRPTGFAPHRRFCEDARSWLKGVCRVEDPTFDSRPGVWITGRPPTATSFIQLLKNAVRDWIKREYDATRTRGDRPRTRSVGPVRG